MPTGFFLLIDDCQFLLAPSGRGTPAPPTPAPVAVLTAPMAMAGGPGLGERYIWDLLKRVDDDEVLLQ